MSIRNVHDKTIGILFIIPTIGFLVFTSLYPLMYAFIVSFFKCDLTISKEMTFIGIQNYIYAFKDKYFLYSFFTSVIFVIVNVSLQFIIGLVIAFLLAREGRGMRIARSIILIPMVIAPVVVGIIWRMLYNPDFGFINYILSLINVNPIQWLGNPKIALISIMITDIWEWLPFVIICLVAGITNLPDDVMEAAKVDGVNNYQLLVHVKMPLLKHVIIVVMLLRLIDAFKIFDTIFVMTQGGPGNTTKLLSFFIYEKGLKYFQVGYASAISWLFIIFMFFFTFYLLKKRQKE